MTGLGERTKVGVVALILFIVTIGTLRPLLHATGHIRNQFGLTRLAFLPEPATDIHVSVKHPGRGIVHMLVPVLVGALLIALKRRRIAFVPVPVRRLKLPCRAATSALPSDSLPAD